MVRLLKELLLMRHAKSSWSSANLSDHQRPLNPRGRRDAPKMARVIERENIVPDLILTSSAARARSTAELVREIIHPDIELQIVDEFYAAPPLVYIQTLCQLSNQYERLLVVGHNPGLEELVHELSGEWHEMPTAAIAHFMFAISEWAELTTNSNKNRLQHIWRPKECD